MNKELSRNKVAMSQEVIKQIQDINNLIEQRKFGDALVSAYKLAKAHKGLRPVELLLGNVLEICKEYEKALNVLSHVHQQTQKSKGVSEISLVISIANCHLKLKHNETAFSLYQEIDKLAPNHPQVQAGLAEYHRRQKNYAVAQDLLKKSLSIKPNYRVAIHEQGMIEYDQENYEKAADIFEKNVRCKDIYGDSIDYWLASLSKLDRNRYAQEVLEGLVKQHPTMVEFVFGFAVLANRAGEITLARPAYEKSLELSPNNPRILYELGVLERTAGNLDKSQNYIGKALDLKPDNPAAIRTYISDLSIQYGDENFKRLNYVAANFCEYGVVEQLHLHYAMGKAFESVGDLDTAFRHYQIAGEKKRKEDHYSDADAANTIATIKQTVNKADLYKTGQQGYDSDTPVFILGMPRSGTSLMEQILSAHPDIFGAGELKILTGVLENMMFGNNRIQMGDKDPVFPFEENASWESRGRHYVDRLTKLADGPNYKRIVDKMPGNFNFVGLIHSILPKAKIIHSRRHPVETCLSCYRIYFAEGHQWTYNLTELGRFYKRYWELMKHWREEFPGVMYEVRYEDNVADVEGQAKKLIEYLDLDWNENCLNFYNIDRPVKTASVTQVRKPIYTTSTNRWRKYEKFLGPLLEELGDIVPEYEDEIAHLSGK